VISVDAKRILIVDDDVALLGTMKDALLSFLRCQVDAVAAPEEAFELALTSDYDLFLFDFAMPIIDGAMLYFLLGKVYNHARPPRVLPPLLLVTGQGEEARAQNLLLQPGVAGLVTKPFQINRLIGKIAASVRGIEMASSG
jgi:DNA-binding response OmpR family regulator